MTKKNTTVVTDNKTQIVCILDASSSMNSIIDEARDGFNKFIDDQKKLESDATLTVATFSSGGVDNGYKLLYNDRPLLEVKPLTEDDWYGNGMTALHDAIGKAITDVSQAHKTLKKSKRPDKVLVAIVTDGHENASKEFNNESIKSLISEMEKNDWEFIYLAADQNAISASNIIGISAGNSLKYRNTAKGNAVLFNTLSMATSSYRGMSKSASLSDKKSIMSRVTKGTGEVGENE